MGVRASSEIRNRNDGAALGSSASARITMTRAPGVSHISTLRAVMKRGRWGGPPRRTATCLGAEVYFTWCRKLHLANYGGVRHMCRLRHPRQRAGLAQRDEMQFTDPGRIDRSQFGEFLSRLRSCRHEAQAVLALMKHSMLTYALWDARSGRVSSFRRRNRTPVQQVFKLPFPTPVVNLSRIAASHNARMCGWPRAAQPLALQRGGCGLLGAGLPDQINGGVDTEKPDA